MRRPPVADLVFALVTAVVVLYVLYVLRHAWLLLFVFPYFFAVAIFADVINIIPFLGSIESRSSSRSPAESVPGP